MEIIIYFVVVYFIVNEDSKIMAQRRMPTEAGVGSHPLYFWVSLCEMHFILRSYIKFNECYYTLISTDTSCRHIIQHIRYCTQQ